MTADSSINPAIHHLLCTHCTFGSSALEITTAETAPRVLGYSVRASSIPDRTHLREEYRAIERLLSYELPSDASADHRKRLTPLTAPLRLLYVPDIAGRQVVGQVAFREFDTSNRPGSYFAHMLVGSGAAPWAVLDCLRLCSLQDPSGIRGWCYADRDGGFPSLLPMSSIGNWLTADRTWLTDQLVRDFLATGRAVSPAPYGSKLTARWETDTQAPQRLTLLKLIAQALLDRESFPATVIAIEPWIAALYFYAALRLLPAAFRHGVSFSTYEADPFRLSYRLAATLFLEPESDFRSDAYQGNSLVVNTLCQSFATSSRTPRPGKWVEWAAARFMDGRTLELDSLAAAVGRVWTNHCPAVAELDELPLLERFLQQLFRNQPFSLERRPAANLHRYLAMRVSEIIRSNRNALCQLPQERSRPLVRNLQRVFSAMPKDWQVLLEDSDIRSWVNGSQPTDTDAVLRRLAQPTSLMSDADAIPLLLSSDIVTIDRRLPSPSPATRRLWGDWTSLASTAVYSPPAMLLTLLGKLPPASLVRVLPRPIPPVSVVGGLLLALDGHLRNPFNTQSSFTSGNSLAMHLRQVLDEAAGDAADVGGTDCFGPSDFELLLEIAGDCRDHYNPSPGNFGSRVSDLIHGLPFRPQDVCKDTRLITLSLQWAGCAPDHEVLSRQLTAWKKILSWFAVLIGNDSIPFAGYWKPNNDATSRGVVDRELTAVIEEMVPSVAGDPSAIRRDVLKRILQVYVKEGLLKSSKKQQSIAHFIDGLYR